MIDERAALVILEGEVSENATSPVGSIKELQRAVKCFADQSLRYFAEGKIQRFKSNFSVATEFLRRGNDNVKNAIVTVYLSTICESFEKYDNLEVITRRSLAREFKSQYTGFYYRSCA